MVSAAVDEESAVSSSWRLRSCVAGGREASVGGARLEQAEHARGFRAEPGHRHRRSTGA